MRTSISSLARPSEWSFRVKVPLLITVVSIGTALAISLAIAISARHWLRTDLNDNAAAVAQSLAPGLVVHMARDDVWEAFEAVRAVATFDSGAPRCDVAVLDRDGRVFVSSDPVRFPVRASESALSGPLRHAASRTSSSSDSSVVEYRDEDGQTYTVIDVPLRSVDNEVMGSLIMSFSHALFAQRYRDTVKTVAAIAIGLVLVLLPFGWWLGHRVAHPVSRVTETLYRLGEDAARKSAGYPSAFASRDTASHPIASELARLEHSLAQLELQLLEKDQLQEQFVAADRLAAIGRMTSGVAHEINNPLAGMLNALSNLRKDPELLSKTVPLIERGLEQIRHTLSALLIETKTATRALEPSDIEDLRVLVLPQARRKRVRLQWSYPIAHDVPVPAAPVRQVVLNLLLNAVQASDGLVKFEAPTTASDMTLRVSNDGDEFPEARRAAPFEPVVGGEGHGMGLWASYHLVIAMGGSITLSAGNGRTSFEVCIPLRPMPAALRKIEPVEIPV